MEIPPQPLIVAANCKCCDASVGENDQFCQSCGFPLKGTEEEQNNFIYERNYKHLELQGLDAKIKSAGKTLFVTAGVFVVWGLIVYAMNSNANVEMAIFFEFGVLAALFVMLGFLSKRKPLAAIITGLALFIVYNVALMFVNPVNIISGLLIKIIIVGYLLKGMQSAFQAERIRKQLNISM